MSNPDEQVNIYDNEGKFIRSMNRLEAEAANHRTENVVIHIYTPDGKLWMQRRALNKTYHPGLWDISSVGGVESHEHRDVAAGRETREEMGISPDLEYIASSARGIPWGDQQLRRYTHLYLGETDQEPIPNHEVLEFKAWDVDLLLTDMYENPHKYLPNIGPLIIQSREYRNTKNPSS